MKPVPNGCHGTSIFVVVLGTGGHFNMGLGLGIVTTLKVTKPGTVTVCLCCHAGLPIVLFPNKLRGMAWTIYCVE